MVKSMTYSISSQWKYSFVTFHLTPHSVKLITNAADQNRLCAYFGQPSNVETVNRARIPLSTLSKLKSLLSHSLLATTVSCREFSICFK